MQELPKIVAQTDVGKTVDVKIWRNEREIIKKIKLGRLETSEDFKAKKDTKEIKKIDILKIKVRVLTPKDIKERKLPNQITGLIITDIQKDSPVNYLKIGNIIVEAEKKKIRLIEDLEKVMEDSLKTSQKTVLIAIYNNQNQKRYIGVKLD